jgi:glutamate/tyrosine decarboxylase-like PLP-dependent enzyme
MEPTNHTLDPADWSELRALGHRMMDDMIDHLAGLRDGPVWRKMPPEVRANFKKPLPAAGADLTALYEDFTANIKPYVTGNTHPRFFGWVHGGGNPVSMLAELLAGAMNANCGGRDHSGIAVERQVIAWAAAMLGMPRETSGVLLTGSSIANFLAVLCARTHELGTAARQEGIGKKKLITYASAGAHRCIPGALDMAGLGTKSLRLIPLDKNFRMDIVALQMAIAEDRAAGRTPFLIIGTAGSVDTGAIDDLNALADISERGEGEKIWFHVDAAFGALAALSPALKPVLAGIQRADSIAFDFHKWAQVTYDAGCLLVRDPDIHLATFAQDTNYLAEAPRGLAAGQPWPCDLGPDLSRGFRALKIWMTFAAYGTEKLAAVVDHTVGLARLLAARIRQNPGMELVTQPALNIVCFRVKSFSDEQTASFVATVQENGSFAPSTTVIGGRLVIRVAIVNHRSTQQDVDALFKAALRASGAFRL